ncbi:unnamed protein product, partial [Mycena citricolor]
ERACGVAWFNPTYTGVLSKAAMNHSAPAQSECTSIRRSVLSLAVRAPLKRE